MSYDYYFARLRGDTIAEHPQEPQEGRWRILASKSNPSGNVNVRPPKSWPVAIWRGEDGNLRVKIGPNKVLVENVDGDAWHQFACETWHRLVPVAEDVYNAVVGGASWPDEHEAVTASNNAPPDDTLEAISERISDLAREAQILIDKGAAKTKDECDRAGDLANLLGQLEKRADELRTDEKAPSIKEGKDIDAKWRTPITMAKDVKIALKRAVVEPWLKAESARVEAERAAQVQAGRPPEDVQRVAVTGGSRGRPVSLRTVTLATIQDQDLVYGFFRENPRVKEVLQELANAAAKQAIKIPGATIITDKVAA